MANEKVYVGEKGAKELYRKIKALIPGAVTVVDEVSINSMDAVTSHAVAVAVGNLTGFQKVNGTGNDKHPDVAEPNTRTIYLVKIPEIVGEDKYKEWIWVIPEQGEGSWECIGSTSIADNSWKQWSEDNRSSATNDNAGKSIYIGPDNSISTYDAVAIGRNNTLTSCYGSQVFGLKNTITGDVHHSFAVGYDNNVKGSYQVNVFGDFNKIDSTNLGTYNSTILGFSNTIDKSKESVIMANGSTSNDVYLSTIIGANKPSANTVKWATVVGNHSDIRNAQYATAVGSAIHIAKVGTDPTTGEPIYLSCDNTTAVGNNMTVSGQNNSVFGYSHNVEGYQNTVLGKGTQVYGDDNVSVGEGSQVTGNSNILISDYTCSINGRNDSVLIGRTSSITKDSSDQTDYSNTNLIAIGEFNSFSKAANAYQIGRDNSVTDNNLELINTYPYQTAINLGVHNTITSEGVNLGKDNTASGFGVTLGQGNTAKYASYAFGNRMEATSGSIAIGGNDGYTTGINVLFYVDGNTATLAEKVKKHDTYTYRSNLVPVKNESGKYVWQSLYTYDTYVIFSNTELHKHILILLGNLNFDSIVKYGYFDSNEEFVETSSSDSRAKPYYHFLTAYDRYGNSYDVSSFYCSLNNGSPVQTGAGYFYAGQSIPSVGWVYDQAGYEDAIAHFYDGGLTPVNYLYVNDSDASIATDNSYYVTEFDVYGYYDSNKFIPYNETNKNDEHDFEWVTVSADKIELRNIVDPKTAGVERETPIADGASILLGNSGHVSGNSIGIIGSKLQLAATFETANGLYEGETSYKKYEINQNSGSYSYSSYSKSFIKASNSSTSNYSYTVGNKRSYIDGISFGIVLNNPYSTKSTTITGNSLGIGSGLDVSGNSYSIGQNNCAYNSSFVLGKENTDVWNKSIVTGFNNASIYENAVVYGCNNTRIGRQQSQSESSMGSSVVIGYSSQQVWGSSLAIGFFNECVTDNSVSVGNGCSYIDDASIGIGQGNRYITLSSVAIGNANTNVSGSAFVFGSMNSNILNASIAIGSFHTNIGEASIAIGLRNSVNSGSVALGEGLNAKNTSFVVGRGATGDGASIVLGNGNTGINAAFIMGIGNRGNYYGDNAIHTNAVILGLGNSVYNHRITVPGISDNGVCSFVAGSYITVYGHNGIGIGSGHIIGNSSKWAQDTTTGSIEPDNDGFMTAIGYKCEALRNYDFAFGYQSKAKGGENVAIGHSEAIGFRNYAFNQSKIKGVTNIGILDSELVTPIENIYSRGKGYTDEAYNVRNFLFHSKLTHSPDPIYGPGDTEHTPNYQQYILTDNICLHSTPTLMHGGNYGFNGNLFAMDRGIMISAANASNNIIWKMYTNGNDSVNVTSTMCRNISIGSKLDISSTHNYTNNITIGGCSVEIGLATGTVNIDSNIVHNSIFRGYNFGHRYGYTCRDNVVLSNSVLDFSNDYVDDYSSRSATFNIVLNGSGLRTYIDENSYWYGGHQPTKSNVLFGTHAFGILGCFSHSDTDSAERSGDYNLFDTLDSTFKSLELTMGSYYSQENKNAYLKNARFATNFGDNALKDINTALVTGESNFVRGVHCAVVHGSANNLINANNSNYGNEALPFISVIGNENRIKNTGYGTYFNHNWVEGNKNWVYGSQIADTRVHGTRNSVTGLDQDNIPSLTLTEITTIQNQYRSGDDSVLRGLFRAAESGTVNYYNDQGTVSTSKVTAGTVYSFKIIDKYNGDRVGINCETASYRTSSLGTGIFYDPTPFDLAHDIYKVTIFGEQNTVTSRIAGYSIFGSDNLIRNTLRPSDSSFCIGNGFIQGNNNIVQNGSNIISMGNGNVSSGHNSVAIGSQLISDQWQTVIGKYNVAKPGPRRTIAEYDENHTYQTGDVVYNSLTSSYYKCTEPIPTVGLWVPTEWKEIDPETDKALFIVGNGYSETDGADWQDESKIHRSNAMEVYADGTVKAHDFVSDNELTLDGQNGVTVSEDLVNSKLVVSLDADTLNIINFLKNRPQNGTYSIQSTNGVLSWVQIGIAQGPVQSQTV